MRKPSFMQQAWPHRPPRRWRLGVLAAAALATATGWAEPNPRQSASPAVQAGMPRSSGDMYWMPAGIQPAPWAHSAPSAADRLNQRQPAYTVRGPAASMDAPRPRQGLIVDGRALGVQLDNGARVTLKRGDGQQMQYFRNRF